MSSLKDIISKLELMDDANSNSLEGGFVLLHTPTKIIGASSTNANCVEACTNNCKGGNCVTGCSWPKSKF